jgi:hypothetical protein
VRSVADAETALAAPEEDGIVEPGAIEEAPEAAQEKPAKPKASKAKEPRKPRKGKPSEEDEAGADAPSVAAHPRAARSVARAKSWGALVGFLLGGYLSLPTHTLAGAGVRAIVAGLVCYVAVWAGALFVWRRMVMVEINARQEELARAVDEVRTRHQAAAAQGAQAAARAQAAAQVAGETPGARR